MSFLHNLFSSPAKAPPNKKRNGPDPDTDITRSGGKRKRDAYDPEEYQNAVYAGAGTVKVHGDDGYEMDGDELDEEEAAVCQLQDEAEIEAGVGIDDGDEDEDEDGNARLYATPKSVRKLSRDLYTALEARSSGRTNTHNEAGKTLAGTSTHVAMSPSPSICTGSETENDEGEILDDIDWSSSDDDLQLSFSPTTSSAGLDVTSTGEIEVDRLRHTPVSKQPRPRAGAVRLSTSITRPISTRLSPSHIRPSSATTTRPTPTKPSPPQPPSQPPMTSPLTTPAHPPAFKYPQDWHEKTPEERWNTQPNLRARELSSPRLIRAELPSEPDYAFRDAEIRDGLWSLMSSVEDFSKKYFPSGAHASHTTSSMFKDTNGDGNENENGDENGDGDGDGDWDVDVFINKDWFSTLPPETAKLINCVASGRPSGLWGWHDLFVNTEKMQALVCGMIGNVLSEQVLQHEFFGGGEEGVGAVRGVQREGKDLDGEFDSLCFARIGNFGESGEDELTY